MIFGRYLSDMMYSLFVLGFFLGGWWGEPYLLFGVVFIMWSALPSSIMELAIMEADMKLE